MPEELYAILEELSQATGKSVNQEILETLIAGLGNWNEGDLDKATLEKLSDVLSGRAGYPDNPRRRENAEFIIKHGMSIDEWNQKLIDAGYLKRNPDGTLKLIKSGVIPN